jgi:transcriptional regulator with XRE-family HTH domain
MEQQCKNSPACCSCWDTVSGVGQTVQASAPANLEALRLIREAFAVSELTQHELALASEIPRSTLANMLSPTAAPRVVHVAQMVQIAVAMGVDARKWIGEIEKLERQRLDGRTGDLGPQRARKRGVPEVQKRAARSRSSRSTTAEE